MEEVEEDKEGIGEGVELVESEEEKEAERRFELDRPKSGGGVPKCGGFE